MALSYKARRRLSLLILLLGLPGYVVVAVTIMSTIDRPPLWLELVIYIGLGILWALPFKAVFRGIGQPDPEAPKEPADKD
jgi:predicted membrane channel-forming protein YqfA (hemolysin III family)